ncbi:hypothetical protein HDV00_011873 [Rhizophlyctis rosea]|nr:hypothetical protein HDV00_011873 [Rhizophlyctis rosea]
MVSDTVSLPDEFPPYAIGAALQYLYLDNLDTISRMHCSFLLAVMRVFDFLCLTEEVQYLSSSITFADCSADTLIEALEMRVTCSSGGGLVVAVAGFLAGNIGLLHEAGPLQDYLFEEPEMYRLLMKEVDKHLEKLN